MAKSIATLVRTLAFARQILNIYSFNKILRARYMLAVKNDGPYREDNQQWASDCPNKEVKQM